MNKAGKFESEGLFSDVQMQKVFADGKTFVDCLPKESIETIDAKYILEKDKPGFNLQEFVIANFDLPVPHSNGYSSNMNISLEENIESLWNVLTRQPDKSLGSLIPLPYPYIVPGGRFGEIYYWDSYFTMLGLKTSGRNDMVENMVNNFSHLIDTLGYIPNGNRRYFIGRSQPPFYALMIELLAGIKGKEILPAYLPQLEKEHGFWMKGASEIEGSKMAAHHRVRMPGGETLNRYWDENDSPRPESFREDVELAQQSGQQEPKKLYRHLRAGAESGWDFCSRWFEDGNTLASIHTTDIVPIDLNCLLFQLEQTLAEAHRLNNHADAANHYQSLAIERMQAIQKYCWNDEQGFYFDFDLVNAKQKQTLSLAGVFPLFSGIASTEQANKLAGVIKKQFLFPGGVVNTLATTGEQWDAPNGWAPLHWITITGLEKFGHTDLASEIAGRWIKLNTEVFNRTGKLMEKYNVVDIHMEAGGGEYSGQDGFGWTNGVLITLINKYGPAS